VSSALGWYSFDGLPVSDGKLFRVGATHDDVFYPGDRVRFSPERASLQTSVQVFDAIPGPSPLIARRHEIEVHTERNLLNVTETIIVSNPSAACYVGGADNPNRPVTLRLGIPSSFEKVTFQKEYFGRRFELIDGVLLTTIPWPPGDRELKFSYIVPIRRQSQALERPLDLPCSDVRVRVIAGDPKRVRCSLPPTEGTEELAFQSTGDVLPAGHIVRVDLGHLSVPFAVYGRWVALGALLACVLAAGAMALRRRRDPNRRTGSHEPRAHRLRRTAA